MDKEARNLIQRATQAARTLLEQEFAEQLAGVFDIRLDGAIADEPGSHLDASQRLVRVKLVAAVEHQRSGGQMMAEVVASYLRELAFTALNRFVALKMLEARGLVQECISRGDQSSGFKEFSGLAPGLVQLPDHGYRLYITPRYVVEFLTDNTLGRIWYEMQRGDTCLVEQCKYLARRPSEVFLAEGEQAADEDSESDEEVAQEDLLRKAIDVPFRPKKDPRDIKLLDPASGSGHFLLYAFDLLLSIYEEAWADQHSACSEATGRTLQEDYQDHDQFQRALPALILRYNLHGIDIDPRAAQIAALSLWMRAQRAYSDFDVSRGDRSSITKTNIVVAEPMPGEQEMLREFVDSLDNELGQLVEQVFAQMELAGEAGSLLKIEERIATSIRHVYGEHGGLFQRVDEERWTEAEAALEQALQAYVDGAQSGKAFRRRLFSEDAAQGLGFIELCRNRYSVVLMNPPFGDRPKQCESLFQASYPATIGDIYAMFFERTLRWLEPGGKVGVISNRIWLSLPTFEALRTKILGKVGVVDVGADLGSFVLEAQVETAAVVIGEGTSRTHLAPWIRLLKTKAKQSVLALALQQLTEDKRHKALYLAPHIRFSQMPSGIIGYWMSPQLSSLHRPTHCVGARGIDVVVGTQTSDDFRFLRLAWEVPENEIKLGKVWARFAKGGEYSPYFDDVHLVVRWERSGCEIAAFPKAYIRNSRFYGRPGVTWPRRTTSPISPRLLPSGCAFRDKGPAVVAEVGVSPYALLALLTSRPARLLLSVRLGAGDDAPGSASKSYEVGLIRDLPYPAFRDEQVKELETLAKRAVVLALAKFRFGDETAACFTMPDALYDPPNVPASFDDRVRAAVRRREDRFSELAQISTRIDEIVADALGFSDDDSGVMNEELEPPLADLAEIDSIDEDLFSQAYLTKDALAGDRLPGGIDAEEDVRIATRRRKQFASLRTEESLCRLFQVTPTVFVLKRRKLRLLRAEDVEACALQVASYALGMAFNRFDPPRSGQQPDEFDALADFGSHRFITERQIRVCR